MLPDVVKIRTRPRFACPKHRNAFVGSRRRNSLRDGSWDIAQLRRVFGALQRTVGTERRTELVASYGSGPSAPWVATSPHRQALRIWRRDGKTYGEGSSERTQNLAWRLRQDKLEQPRCVRFKMLGFVYPATLCVVTPGRRLDRVAFTSSRIASLFSYASPASLSSSRNAASSGPSDAFGNSRKPCRS